MRITGGTARGRRLTTPKGDELIRPTSDRVREALFSIVAAQVPGSKVLDLFAGTGALGIEALSRGADFAAFVDQSKDAARLIQTNLLNCFKTPRAFFALCKLPGSLPRLAAKLPQEAAFDLVFMDPPYNKNLAPPVLEQLQSTKLLASDALIIVEEHQHAKLPEQIAALKLIDQRSYGETGIWLYAPITSNKSARKGKQ